MRDKALRVSGTKCVVNDCRKSETSKREKRREKDKSLPFFLAILHPRRSLLQFAIRTSWQASKQAGRHNTRSIARSLLLAAILRYPQSRHSHIPEGHCRDFYFAFLTPLNQESASVQEKPLKTDYGKIWATLDETRTANFTAWKYNERMQRSGRKDNRFPSSVYTVGRKIELVRAFHPIKRVIVAQCVKNTNCLALQQSHSSYPNQKSIRR